MELHIFLQIYCQAWPDSSLKEEWEKAAAYVKLKYFIFFSFYYYYY